jgi:hypothetical protein
MDSQIVPRGTAVGICVSRLSASQLALLASLLQLAVALGLDHRLSPREHVARRHIADGAVRADHQLQPLRSQLDECITLCFEVITTLFQLFNIQWENAEPGPIWRVDPSERFVVCPIL